jgi:hypothetical protein
MMTTRLGKRFAVLSLATSESWRDKATGILLACGQLNALVRRQKFTLKWRRSKIILVQCAPKTG